MLFIQATPSGDSVKIHIRVIRIQGRMHIFRFLQRFIENSEFLKFQELRVSERCMDRPALAAGRLFISQKGAIFEEIMSSQRVVVKRHYVCQKPYDLKGQR